MLQCSMTSKLKYEAKRGVDAPQFLEGQMTGEAAESAGVDGCCLFCKDAGGDAVQFDLGPEAGCTSGH